MSLVRILNTKSKVTNNSLMKVISTTVEWILEFGFWNDKGRWNDSSTWND